MRTFFACTAEAYDLLALSTALKENHTISREKDALYIQLDEGDVFYFAYGCVVCWGLSYEEERDFLSRIRPYEKKPLSSTVEDFIHFNMGKSFKISNDELILANRDFLNLLALSHGLAQSIKLDTFENSVDQTVDKMKPIPQQMARLGKVSLSRREIRKKMGELFIERNSINLHSDILDKPELLWVSPEVEPIYTLIANYFELHPRVEVLNRRLEAVHELYDILNTELNHQQSSRLEWTIIILIFIEVGITLMRDVFRWI